MFIHRAGAAVSGHSLYVTRTNAGSYAGFTDSANFIPYALFNGPASSDVATLPDLNEVLVVPEEAAVVPEEPIFMHTPDRSIYIA
jgi:hypothetical protein